MLRLSGTSRQAIAAEQARLREAAREAVADAEAHNRRAAELDHTARGAQDGPQARRGLEALTGQWETKVQAARQADARLIDDLGRQAIGHDTAASQWRQHAQALRVEETTRGGMSPHRARIEDLDRSAVLLRERAEQAAARRQAVRQAQPAHEYHRYHDPSIDRGPQLGL